MLCDLGVEVSRLAVFAVVRRGGVGSSRSDDAAFALEAGEVEKIDVIFGGDVEGFAASVIAAGDVSGASRFWAAATRGPVNARADPWQHEQRIGQAGAASYSTGGENRATSNSPPGPRPRSGGGYSGKEKHLTGPIGCAMMVD